MSDLIKLQVPDLIHTMSGMPCILYLEDDDNEERRMIDFPDDKKVIFVSAYKKRIIYVDRGQLSDTNSVFANSRDYLVWTARRVFELVPWANWITRSGKQIAVWAHKPIREGRNWFPQQHGDIYLDFEITISDIFRGLSDDQAIISREECEVKDDQK